MAEHPALHAVPADRPLATRRLRDVPPDPAGARLARHAIDRAVRLAAGLRDEGPHTVAEITDELSRQQMVALAVALAAMVPADVDPHTALAWVELPASQWPDSVVLAEADRHEAGATDATAALGALELDRRAQALTRRGATA